jgi:hypothetical protein
MMWYDFLHPSDSALSGPIPEDNHFMLRSSFLVLAISCAITCYAQQPAPQQPAPSATTGAQGAMAPGANAGPATPPPATVNVPMSEPVITLKGACQATSAGTPPAGCVSSLTREQFEKLTSALQPADRGPVPPEARRRFAAQYAKLLTFADAARQLGLENDPKVTEILVFLKNQVLAEQLNQHLVEQYSHPTDQQIQDYYNQNTKKYMEATLQRIIIPMNPGNNADKPKPTDEEQKAYAEKIRQRWVAGEDAVKLEKEAMDHNGVTTAAPDVNVGARRPGSLPEKHESVFDLKAGEISPLYSDPAAFYFYKVVSVRQVPLSEVKATITQTIQKQEFNDKIQQVQSAVTPVLNDAYFGPEQAPSVPHNMIGPGGMQHPGGPPSPNAPPPPAPGTAAPPK